MKRTAFNLNLILILSFIGLAILAHFTGAGSSVVPFFITCAVILTILLPSCSRTN